jgi:transposase
MYENHPYADVWPSLEGADFAALVVDIQANGQRLPIILHDNKILDGRNRYRVCLQLGIEPKVQTYTGSDEEAKALVRSLNEHRRHLTHAQKRESVQQLHAANPGMSARQIADIANVSTSTVSANVQSGQLQKARKVSTKHGRTYTVLPKDERDKRDAAIMEHRKKGSSIVEIAKLMQLPERTVYDVVGRVKVKPRPVTRRPVPQRPSLGSVPALTREQVDPEFTGTPIEFVDKYGHVQMETAEQRATSRFGDWAIVVGYLGKKFREQPGLPEVDVNWLRKPRQADIERMRAALALLEPMLAQARILLDRADKAQQEKAA